MKALIFMIFFISFGVNAEHGVEVKYLRINQDLFGTIELPMDAVGVGYSYQHNGFGIRLELSRSTETANKLFVEGLHYSNKINVMYGAQLFYRHEFFEVGFGKTDYKSTWKVNGVKPSWSDGTDSDWAYHARIYYPINKKLDVLFGYSDLYRKHKKDHGREETKAFTIGLLYEF